MGRYLVYLVALSIRASRGCEWPRQASVARRRSDCRGRLRRRRSEEGAAAVVLLGAGPRTLLLERAVPTDSAPRTGGTPRHYLRLPSVVCAARQGVLPAFFRGT